MCARTDEPLARKNKIIAIFRQTEEALNEKRQLITKGEIDSTPINNDKTPRIDTYPDYYNGLVKDGRLGDAKPIEEHEICCCSHGSGFRYLQNVLSGLSPGCQLSHQPAFGIQVHPYPVPLTRLEFYARKSKAHFDTPAILRFNIEARHLDSPRNSNPYEAGLRNELIKHAKNFRLENCVTGEVILGDNLDQIRAEISKRKIGIGNF